MCQNNQWKQLQQGEVSSGSGSNDCSPARKGGIAAGHATVQGSGNKMCSFQAVDQEAERDWMCDLGIALNLLLMAYVSYVGPIFQSFPNLQT